MVPKQKTAEFNGHGKSGIIRPGPNIRCIPGTLQKGKGNKLARRSITSGVIIGNAFLDRHFMLEVLVGRQPVFDAELNVIGYELLYRCSEENQANFVDGNLATSSVIANAFLEMGLKNLVGDKLAFINLPRDFITGKLPLPFDEGQLVLEVLEDVVIDEEIVASLQALADRGFTLAMDDVVEIDSIQSVLGLVDIIKIDLMHVDRNELPGQIAKLKEFPLKLLAEKVETQEEFRWCKDLGFDYFQGYFLCKPNIIKQKKLSVSSLCGLRLLAELNSPTTEISQIEPLVLQDVGLSYKMLRLINSATFAFQSEISSVRQALALLGLRKVQSWASLLVLAESSDKPVELVNTAMIRGKMCELLAREQGSINPEASFTVGFFSILDALMDMTFPEILKQVPLSTKIQMALLKRQGDLGKLLKCVLAFEKGDFDKARFGKLSSETIQDCYLEAVQNATRSQQVLAAL